MIQDDYLLRAVDHSKQIRIMLASTTGVVQEAQVRHHTSATASAALGRVLTATLMMGSDLKDQDNIITLRLKGQGPGGAIVATADNQGRVRGLISYPQADVPSLYPGKLAVGALVGNDGYLEVIKDLGLKQPFVGRTRLVSGEIAEDLAHYFLMSEQIPSLVSLGVLVAPDLSIKAAGGLFVQALPGSSDQVLQMVENNVLSMGAISKILEEKDSLESVLKEVMKDIPYEVVGKMPLAFECNCSHERLKGILSGLLDQDITDLCDDRGEIEVCCNFCNQMYSFKGEELLPQKSEKP
ncbi:MAG TPA: Hsp33 family molecular chaperone HslO [Syntrophomonadaceae bacterium]|nr:Hsp33 family molecular chaperone HslO [Syntrophomonadaceae bacterium]